MEELVIRHRYGNGSTTTYRRAVATPEEQAYRASLCQNRTREEENQRLRTSKSRSNAKTRAMSANFTHFVTFTTSDITLAMDGKTLLTEVCNELKRQNAIYHAQLEAFENENRGFHVHGLTDREIFFDNWIINHGFNDEKGEDLEENFEDREKNLYCEEIGSSQEQCIDYFNKRIEETKRLLPSGTHIYKSNVKKIKAETRISIYDSETNEENVLFSNERTVYNVISIDTNDTNNHFIALNSIVDYDKSTNTHVSCISITYNYETSHVSECSHLQKECSHLQKKRPYLQKNVLNVEEGQEEQKNRDFGVIKSNTKQKGCLIPFENAMKIKKIQNFDDFLRLYIGYICHIPD